jgi:hypothetical protein
VEYSSPLLREGRTSTNSTRWPAACCNQRWSNARCD